GCPPLQPIVKLSGALAESYEALGILSLECEVGFEAASGGRVPQVPLFLLNKRPVPIVRA
ncbi:MAG: hypothetical protein KJ994_05875, partial [Candidatus Omnitrophica bacterium]|nr:hypothetical protein [Candidatus Omnitrophota bacterium]